MNEMEALLAALRRLRRELEGVVGAVGADCAGGELAELVRQEEKLVCADLLGDAALATDRRERLSRMAPAVAARFVREHTLEVLSGMQGSPGAFAAALELLVLEARTIGRLERPELLEDEGGIIRRLPPMPLP